MPQSFKSALVVYVGGLYDREDFHDEREGKEDVKPDFSQQRYLRIAKDNDGIQASRHRRNRSIHMEEVKEGEGV
jgi:hypothetical protein